MKPENKAKLRERAQSALRALYHNATVNYPRLPDADCERFQAWYDGAAESEVHYLRSAGAYGTNYRETLAHPANAGRFKSARAREYYIAKGMRAMHAERADCGALTGWNIFEAACQQSAPVPRKAGPQQRAIGPGRNNAQWERITEYGELYQYGRGGRTLAPADLWRDGGMGHGPRGDYPDELNAESLVDFIRVLESFNAYVHAWCESVPEQWAQYEADRIAEEKAEARARSVRKAAETRERRYWEARGVVTV